MPKPRLLLLFVMIGLFIITPIYFSNMPAWSCILLGLFCADLFYFLFVVLKVQRNLSKRIKPITNAEQQAHLDAMTAARKIAQSGIVLLQNTEDLLPLSKGAKLNLIGLRCVQMNYNGGGSAASDESKCTTLEAALRETGFELNQDLLNLSYHYLKDESVSIAPMKKNHKVKQGNRQKGGAEFIAKPGSPVKTELPVAALTSKQLYPDGRSILEHAKEFSNVALVVLSRGGGEGYELDPDDLRLIESERLLLNEVCRHFDQIILILNTANTMEMGWLKDYPSIRSVLWTGFSGTVGNLALGDILNGTVNPSGHLPDTWAASNLSAPAANNFCQLQPNGAWAKENFHYENAPDKQGYFVHYSEGIYVGYRYYETRAAADASFDYQHEVIWPFGFGMSYTSFSQKINGLVETDTDLSVTVTVTNTGSRPGRALVQCYSTPPYTGKIEKSAVNLVSFEKTGEIPAGAHETVQLDIPKQQLSSFDEKTGFWTLEAGEYLLSIRSDSHTVLEQIAWSKEADTRFPGTRKLFSDADTDSLTRSFDPSHRAFTGPRKEDFTADQTILSALKFHVPTDKELALTEADRPTTDHFSNIKLQEMVGIAKDDPRWDTFVQQLTLADLCNLCGNGAWQTIPIRRLGVPRTVSPDGPTSMAATVFSALVMGTGKAGITWPSPSILAAAFDRNLARLMGDSIGREGRAMGYSGWYAPAMNCHRTAFNSRNFEYYSEDPLLSGKTAAQVVRGVQEHKIITYIKHFALNERETNARNQLFTWCGEQAMREIYLRPFELAVRKGGALGVMSCFNYIGHTWAGGNRALIHDLLVEEWGFEGTVVTDACLYPHMDVTQMIYAGGDLSLDTLGGFTGGNIKRRNLLAAAQDPRYKIAMTIWLQAAAKDILFTVSKTMG